MRVNIGLIFWGVALITAGVVALAVQAGAISEDSARDVWRFWPVIIIVIGLAVIAARTPFAAVATVVAALVVGGMAGTLVAGFPNGFSFGCEGDAEQTLTDSGSFDGDAEVALDLNCGQMNVTTAAGSDWSLDARYAGDAPQVLVRREGGQDVSSVFDLAAEQVVDPRQISASRHKSVQLLPQLFQRTDEHGQPFVHGLAPHL